MGDMRIILRSARSYPFVTATLLVAATGLILLATPARGASEWVVGGYALVIAGWQAVGMVRQLLRGHAGLDVLAVIAIVAAVLVGESWAALVVVLMLTGGEALEDYAENRSTRELTALLNRAPQRAIRLEAGERREIGVDEIAVGDEILVLPGAVVPVDGILLSEAATFDESSLTGESLPVDRTAGEKLLSGIVSGSSAVTIRAIAVAADSQYQQIVNLVREAAGSKAQVVRLADRYAVPFTAVALLIAGAAWALSGDPVRFAEVLVVATPCPLLIAAPVAFLGGMSRAAREGIIVKGGGTLEQLARVRAVAFDKTGTITTGRPSLRRIEPSDGFTENEVLQLAASAEVYSSHVLAASVIDEAKARGLALAPAGESAEIATNGVRAVLGDRTVRVGKPAWVAESVQDFSRAEIASGELAIYVGVDDRLAGVIVMRDRVRPEAAATLDALRGAGVGRILMVTGDVEPTARPIAESLGIEELHAECLPADKVRIIAGVPVRPLLMVGDGLNDAPVLAAADIGYAMGARGATAASESADVVGRFDTLAGVGRAVQIGHDTVRIALQSIWLGIVISGALMLVAATGVLPALLGAWMQEGVDLIALLGALRALGPRSERRKSAVEKPLAVAELSRG